VDAVVAIATSGRPDLLTRTLKSLGQCQLPSGYRETLVIENGSRAGAEDVVKSATPQLNTRYIHIDQANKSAALNAALDAVGDCLMIFSDDDVRFAPGTISAYADADQKRGPGSYYGGPLDIDYDVPPPQWLREYLPCSVIGWELGGEERAVQAVEFLGANWAAHAADLRAAGGFSVDFGPGSRTGCTGQETEMQHRLTNRGASAIYVPGARVWHYVPKNRCTPDWVLDRNYRNGVQDGILATGGHSSGLPPWWITSRYIKGILRSWLSTFSTSPETRFKAKNRRSYDRGLISGIRSHNGQSKPAA
jgi:GT2 family glycosyltransferase